MQSLIVPKSCQNMISLKQGLNLKKKEVAVTCHKPIDHSLQAPIRLSGAPAIHQ